MPHAISAEVNHQAALRSVEPPGYSQSHSLHKARRIQPPNVSEFLVRLWQGVLALSSCETHFDPTSETVVCLTERKKKGWKKGS